MQGSDEKTNKKNRSTLERFNPCAQVFFSKEIRSKSDQKEKEKNTASDRRKMKH